MGILERAFPSWAAKREAARLRYESLRHRREMLATLGAAERGRLAADWHAPLKSADGIILPDNTTINARARLAVYDDWVAASIVGGYRRHIIGTGITARASARHPDTDEALTDFNKAADKLWTQWARRPQWCDRERRKSLVEIQNVGISDLITVGQSFAVTNYEPDADRVGLSVQVLEVEQLDLTKDRNSATGNEIRGGVEIDSYGAPVAYHIFTRAHPYDGWRRQKSERIPADRVLHLMRQDRPRQVYGISRLTSILKKLRHLQMYEEYQMVAARLEACIGAVIQVDASIGDGISALGLEPQTGDATTDDAGNPQIEFQPGMFPRLNPGEEVNWHKPNRPGDMYEPYVKAQLKATSAGSGLDYPTVSRDFSGNTYAGQRQGMLERDKETDPLQMLMVDLWLRNIRDEFITLAVLEGRLDAPDFFNDPRWAMAYLSAEWQPPPKPWIDPQNQANAAKTQIEMGITTRRKILNELSEDWIETIEQLGDENRLAEQQGVSIGGNGSQPSGGSANGQPERNEGEAEQRQFWEHETCLT
jgi:lambda family phage portal protein